MLPSSRPLVCFVLTNRHTSASAQDHMRISMLAAPSPAKIATVQGATTVCSPSASTHKDVSVVLGLQRIQTPNRSIFDEALQFYHKSRECIQIWQACQILAFDILDISVLAPSTLLRPLQLEQNLTWRVVDVPAFLWFRQLVDSSFEDVPLPFVAV